MEILDIGTEQNKSKHDQPESSVTEDNKNLTMERSLGMACRQGYENISDETNLPRPTFCDENQAKTAESDTSRFLYDLAQKQASSQLGNVNTTYGGKVAVKLGQSHEEYLRSSISNIKKDFKVIAKAIVLEGPENYQQASDYVDWDTKARETRLRAIFATGTDLRLKVLTADNVRDLMSSCINESDHKGGFSDIYVSKDKIPGINMRLVMKKVQFSKRDAEQTMKFLTNEKLCARIMHFAIVPLLGIRQDYMKRECYFLSHYMENGDLNSAIEKDNELIRTKKDQKLDVSTRLRILYHIASAMAFLHTPVMEIRAMNHNMNIKSLNIVLDKNSNARLTEFGLASEMKHGHFSTPGRENLAKYDDNLQFGVVMREILTGRKPFVEGCPEETLRDQSVNRIKRTSMEMWKNLNVGSPVLQSLVDLSDNCINDTEMTSETIVTELKQQLLSTKTTRWRRSNEETEQSENCEMCLGNKAVKNNLLFHENCNCHLKVCYSCMRNSYCNPMRCHSCDTMLIPTIGHGWAALQLAENDVRDSVANSCTYDVKAIQKVITSKCPLAIGVRKVDKNTLHTEYRATLEAGTNEQQCNCKAAAVNGIQTLCLGTEQNQSKHDQPVSSMTISDYHGFSGQFQSADERDATRKRSFKKERDPTLPQQTLSKTVQGNTADTIRGSSKTQAIAPLGNSNIASATSVGNFTVDLGQSNRISVNVHLELMKTDVSKGPGSQILENQNAPDYDTITRETSLSSIFAAGTDMRLKVLTADNVKDLLSSSGNNPNHKGRFSDIYVSKDKIPGIKLRLVMGKVQFSKRDAEQTMKFLTNEKLCARVMHFAIVPLLGIRQDYIKRECYFLSPYMENGDLNSAIEKDNELIKMKKGQKLDVSTRLRILYQIASAMDFLHTPVSKTRALILHMDIKSLNIVLDQNRNARLTDFGLSREMKHGHDHTQTSNLQYFSTPGYFKNTGRDNLAKSDDYRQFGVVMREILTGRKPFIAGCQAEPLRDQSVNKIKRTSMEMWKNLNVGSPVLQSLVDLSHNCINGTEMTSETIVTELKQQLLNTKTTRWGRSNEEKEQSENCEMCLENKAVKDKLLFHENCNCHIKVCVSCMRNSYCNPIRCHSCETKLTPTIGHGWAALLIAGNDVRDSVAKSFTYDVKAIQKVITSKCPLVMGVSAQYVKTVYPDEPGKPESMLDKLQKSVDTLKKIDDIQTLLVYFSGNHMPAAGGYQLGHCTTQETGQQFEYLSYKDFENVMASILCQPNPVEERSSVSKRLIVFLDCCSAQAVTRPSKETNHLSNATDNSGDEIAQNQIITLDQDITIVQINACRPNQRSLQEQDGSLFRKFLIQGLTRKALGEVCLYENCRSDCSIVGDFITVSDLNNYISNHVDKKNECVMHMYNVSKNDAKIGYAINFYADLEFTFKFKSEQKYVRIKPGVFSELQELQTLLFDSFVKNFELESKNEKDRYLFCSKFCDILCVEVEKSHRNDRLHSLDRIMAAWNAKRELVVSLRKLHEVRDGMVGIFMSHGQTTQPILEFLQKSDVVEADGENSHATICIVKLNDNFSDFKQLSRDLDDLNRSSSMETFFDHIIDIEDALKTMPNDEINLKELHILFPCSSSTGKRVHRRNIVCYQLKRDNDLQ